MVRELLFKQKKCVQTSVVNEIDTVRGIPQASVLLRILFILHVNDLYSIHRNIKELSNIVNL